jgi:hypothetical protein
MQLVLSLEYRHEQCNKRDNLDLTHETDKQVEVCPSKSV